MRLLNRSLIDLGRRLFSYDNFCYGHFYRATDTPRIGSVDFTILLMDT